MRHIKPNIGKVSLSTLLPGCRFLGGGPIHVSSCCDDSRTCQPGDLFAALVGPNHDGHDYVGQAILRGATAILAERPVVTNVPTCLVDDSRSAFARLCQVLSGNPTRNLKTVGITGSHGKTSVAVLLTSILEEGCIQVGVVTSLGNCDGVHASNPSARTLTPVEIARWMGSARDAGCSHAILELSSAALAARAADGVSLDVGILTNIRREHIREHGTAINYRRIKERLFQLVQGDGIAVCNADDLGSKFVIENIKRPLLTFGIQNEAQITARLLEVQHGEQTFLLDAGDECIPVRTKAIGTPHVYNCLAAASAALAMGIDLETIVAGLEKAPQAPGCLEYIPSDQEFATYLDAAPSADTLSHSLKSLRSVTSGKITCVLSPGVGQDQEERPLFGRVLERFADRGIITGFAGRHAVKHWAHDVIDGYSRPALAHVIPDRRKAIAWALQNAAPGDTVLIAGAGIEAGELDDLAAIDLCPTRAQLRDGHCERG
jgi:UDP-N-acetylmuramoyl-L-alanyl-D-glutamate--2,6-diaminopimelate ligase